MPRPNESDASTQYQDPCSLKGDTTGPQAKGESERGLFRSNTSSIQSPSINPQAKDKEGETKFSVRIPAGQGFERINCPLEAYSLLSNSLRWV
jgi:hypothetical protein